MAKIYKASGEVVNVSPKNGKDFKLEELQEIVGGFIEVVTLSDNKIMVVNEEGKIEGLPKNHKATEILNANTDPMFEFIDYIVGDALICNGNEVR